MSNAISKIEKILKSEYSIQGYTEFVSEIFDSVELIAPDKFHKEFSNYSSHIEGYSHVGNYKSPDNKRISIFSVQLKTASYVESSRSTQRSYARKLIDAGNSDAAIIAFYTQNEAKWRISFVRLDFEMKFESGKFKAAENLTPAKRYSFLVGQDEPCHTAISRFRKFIVDENYNPTLDEIEEAFSVEKVTNEFFELYCEKYHQLREALEKNDDFIEEAKLHNFNSAQFAKKLMGQIVFLYFLQKKGWLGVSAWPRVLNAAEYKKAFFARGAKSRELIPAVYTQVNEDTFRLNGAALQQLSDDDETFLSTCVKGEPWGTGPHNFMRKLFDISEKRNANFYDDFLEPLFYDALNVNRGEQGYDPDLHCRIPFLSGGLFEPMDGYDWQHNRFAIPNELFSNKKTDNDRLADGILDIFDRYNFTMSEDEPLEREVAIDPEMLGKVFENLLDVNDRKSKGAFYTPREIVHYMCQESLINYLTNTMKVKESSIRDFILYGDFMKDEDASVLKRAEKGDAYDLWISDELYLLGDDGSIQVDRVGELDKALQDVRIADPAVGSGAFPLGMLNEIVRARQNITTYMDITQKIVDPKGAAREIRYRRINDRSARQLKFDTIRNSIYAVDVEPSAVDIARLRLWLALMIDDEIDPTALTALDGHRNPLPLPNLECNILCGNSLIDEFEGIKLINNSEFIGTAVKGSQGNLYQSAFDATVQRLIDKQQELFKCENTDRKVQLLQDIAALRDEVIMTQLQGATFEQIARYEDTKNMTIKPFVLWQLDFAKVFNEKGGFDIVIGNPPYIGESGHKEIFRAVAETEFGKRFYQGKMDYFYFFINKGIDILSESGNLTFITTNYYPTATGAKKLRRDIHNRTSVLALINFNEVRVFESALGQHNMITFLSKKKGDDVKCRSVMCTESITADAAKLRSILHGSDANTRTVFVAQDNLFDGDECYIRQEGVSSNNSNTVGSIIDKMAQQSLHLSDIAEVNQGVLSGCDTVAKRNIDLIPKESNKIKDDGIFVFDLTNSRDLETISSFDMGKELLRDFYKNSDIARYYCSIKPTKKLLYYQDGLDSNKYPDIEKHLTLFKPLLEQRLTTYNEHYHWTALHRARKERIFYGPKIVVPYRTRENSFAYNEVEWFCRSDCYVITPKDACIDLYSVLGILNSKLNFVWLYHRGKRKGEILELFQVPLSEIPIINLDENGQKRIATLAKEITEKKRENPYCDTEVEEMEIDYILYEAYGLNGQEVEMVEQFIRDRKGKKYGTD